MSSISESVTILLGTLALAAAWLVFRLERRATWRREVDSARSMLDAVHRGMVEGLDGTPGWGEIYFETIYDGVTAPKRGLKSSECVMGQPGGWDQVFLVPTEPLAFLATASAGTELISPDTVAIANFALWRVHVFNQLVQQQTDFNTQHAAEIFDSNLDTQRRIDLGQVAQELSVRLHGDGIGHANSPGNWYFELKRHVEADRTRLSNMLATRPLALPCCGPPSAGYLRLVWGDFVVLSLTVVGLALAGINLTDSSSSNSPWVGHARCGDGSHMRLVPGCDGRAKPGFGHPRFR